PRSRILWSLASPTMNEAPVYVSRLVRLPLLDADQTSLGRLDDVVIGPSGPAEAPRVLGFVALVQRREIFVNANRVARVDVDGAHLHTGTVDLRRFQLRPGELLVRRQLFDRQLDSQLVNDVSIRATPGQARSWEVDSVSLTP